jgi:DNA-binding MltR family transcriptional regulator
MADSVPESFDRMLRELIGESDRGCALVSAAYLDSSLEQALRAKLWNDQHCVKKAVEPLFDQMGPLSSFSAKIKLVYAMQLITAEQFKILEIVRRIRNQFAHSFDEASFTSPDILQLVANLTGSVQEADQNRRRLDELEFPPIEVTEAGEPRMKVSVSKLKFLAAVSFVAGFINKVGQHNG